MTDGTPRHTHKATLTVYSDEESPDVWIKVDWDPKLDKEAIVALGYMPAAYAFIQEHVVPMLEKAYRESLEGIAETVPVSQSIN